MRKSSGQKETANQQVRQKFESLESRNIEKYTKGAHLNLGKFQCLLVWHKLLQLLVGYISCTNERVHKDVAGWLLPSLNNQN